jgi:hypothetical protein
MTTMNHLLCNLKAIWIEADDADLKEEYEASVVEKYLQSGKAIREQLWMQHRNLRVVFDRIEKEV